MQSCLVVLLPVAEAVKWRERLLSHEVQAHLAVLGVAGLTLRSRGGAMNR